MDGWMDGWMNVLDFGVFISFIGSTCCSLLAFVFPVIFGLQLFR
jgi:hypothetical protein